MACPNGAPFDHLRHGTLMRIAFYCPNKPLAEVHPSGDHSIAQGIFQSLVASGHECVEMSRFRARWFWKSLQGWGEAVLAIRNSWLAARAFRPDLWFTYHSYYKSPDVIGPVVSRRAHIPYVLFQPMFSTRRRKDPSTRIGFYLNRLALRSGDHAFTNNLLDLPALHRIFPEQSVTYLAPGIFPENFQRSAAAGLAIRERHGLAPDHPVLLTAARFREGVKTRSLEYLLQALVPLVRDNLPFALLLVGDGPTENRIKELAVRHLPGRAIFCGRVPRSEMFRYYSAADVFVFPGIGESLGMVYLEAQACGLPVVALDTAGVPQAVSRGHTALLVPGDGGGAFAAAVRTLLTDSTLRAFLAANGPRFISEERNLHRNYSALTQALQALGNGAPAHPDEAVRSG
ncbi:MAG TPA: glycosyl transferase family 1 [Syntrophobacteraceae bacterium]|nr:glycosyl transferase family 1 [Syntrophobacteraceae bacterium]